MKTPLQVDQGLSAVRQANEVILRQLRNLALNPLNCNAKLALNDALKSHGHAIAELWKPEEIPVSVVEYKLRQRKQLADQ